MRRAHDYDRDEMSLSYDGKPFPTNWEPKYTLARTSAQNRSDEDVVVWTSPRTLPSGIVFDEGGEWYGEYHVFRLCGCFALIVVLVLLRNLMGGGGVWNVGEGQAVWLGHYVCDVSVWCASEEGVRMKVGMYRVGNVCSLRNDGYLVLLQDIIED
jgi:hypothetical protein